MREDNSEKIAKNIEGNLEEDTKSSMSREEEIPQEEEDNLNESSGEDEEMYSWDELEYKANYVCFISNESTEKQVRICNIFALLSKFSLITTELEPDVLINGVLYDSCDGL